MDHQELHWPLTVLTRAVRHKNLSGAALQVGISQPQLSRLMKKIEDALQIPLLHRGAKRNSSWTAEAHRLALLYSESEELLSQKLDRLQKSQTLTQLRFATLEGLIETACQMAYFLEQHLNLKQIFLDVLDLNDLNERFVNGEVDLALTSQSPSTGKAQRIKILGFQNMTTVNARSGAHQVMSQFEYLSLTRPQKRNIQTQKSLISNSLAVRKLWHSTQGSQTILLPGSVQPTHAKGRHQVLVLGADFLPKSVWEQIQKFEIPTSCGNKPS